MIPLVPVHRLDQHGGDGVRALVLENLLEAVARPSRRGRGRDGLAGQR